MAQIKAFSLGAKNKKDLEKQKKLADEEAAAEAYEQFVATFETPKQTAKLFVRGNVINPSSGQEISVQQSGKFYKPDKLQDLERQKKHDNKRSEEKASKSINYNEKPPKKKGDVKKKSNLEMFKEELKMIQEERQERSRFRGGHGKEKPHKSAPDDEHETSHKSGSHDTGDPNTTNIYLGNLSTKMTETQLCEIFGRYGPLASVKIMWPRTDEERTRNHNCGFVAFMCRTDGERAMKAIRSRKIMSGIRCGWAAKIQIPPNPVYIPPALRELTVPPPPSGLPFNAQVVDERDKELLEQYGNDPQRLYREDRTAFDELLSRAVVKVVTPTERTLTNAIHRVIEFVVREGHMFEALLMSRESGNPLFQFLFDNYSPAHVYYRWRLFSILQGEHPSRWRTKEFRMFENGSLWRPPPINPYMEGMPEHLLPHDEESDNDSSRSDSDSFQKKNQKKDMTLHDLDREELEEMLRTLTPQRSKIGDLMVFAIEHADCSDEIVECLVDSLCICETKIPVKIARLYVVSDILNNCSVKVANVSNYRKVFQSKMISIFESLNQTYTYIEGRLQAEQFKQRVMNCFRAWEETAIYSSEFLIKLQNIFLGLSSNKDKQQQQQQISGSSQDTEKKTTASEDIDGVPILDPDLDGEEISDDNLFSAKFKPSKWETVDPEVVESQAITSKWENLDKSSSIFADDDIDGKPLDDNDYFESLIAAKQQMTFDTSTFALQQSSSTPTASTLSREVLREIELKVVKYQDDLEANLRSSRLKTNENIVTMVEKFRAELVRKANATHSSPHRASSSFSPLTASTAAGSGNNNSIRRSRSRSRSPKSRHSSYHQHSKSKYQSPARRSRSRSRSPSNKRRK